MSKLILSLMLLLIASCATQLYAQDDLKIKNASGTTLMEVRDEGVIITKLTTSERTANAAALTNAESGLMVYDTDTQSFWVWKSTEWEEIAGTGSVDDADNDPTNELELPTTPQDGTITYFDDGDWQALDPGTPGQFLTFNGEFPNWQDAGCALGEAVSDQSQLLESSFRGFSNLGQSFTAGKTGCLSKVRIRATAELSTATIAPTVEIQAGATETGNPISSVEAIPIPTTESSPLQWYEITFSNPAQVVEGSVYTIVLRANCTGSPDCLDGDQGLKTRRQSGNPYQGGRILSNGSSNFDIPFETFVQDGTNLFADADADPTNEIELPATPQDGTMTFYESGDWQPLAPGTPGQFLILNDGTPSWQDIGIGCTLGASVSDQSQILVGPTVFVFTVRGQSFTAGKTGCLNKVRVNTTALLQDETIAPTVEIQEGSTQTSTAISSVEPIPMPSTGFIPPQWYEITFETPAQVVAGNQYTIVLRANCSGCYDGVGPINLDNAFAASVITNNPYPGGELLGTSNPNADMAFETFVIDETNPFADADADPTNEIELPTGGADGQVLSTDGAGNYSWTDNVDEVDDADADPTNEIQAISKSGNTVSLSNNGGSFTDEVDDADADPTNEIELPDNPQDGTIAYFANGAWQSRTPGSPGQMLTLNNNGIPRWSNAPRFGFTKRTGVQSFNDEDGWEAITNTLTVDIGAGGRVLIDAQATVRLTSGSLLDPFNFKVVANPSGSDGCTDLVDLNTIVHVPDTESGGHQQWTTVPYLENWVSSCGEGVVRLTLYARNTGDDPWQVQDAILSVTTY
ncbi:MAG: hypothetical protein AAGF87_14520 [Bacteroidota bacterium]